MLDFNKEYFYNKFNELVNIDSTTGHYSFIQDYIKKELDNLGYSYTVTHKGGVISTFGGDNNPICISGHLDDIGLMVRKINSDGTLNVCSVGGLYPFYCLLENVNVYTRDDKVYTGTICRNPNSIHVTEEELRSTPSDFRKNVCVVLDNDTSSFEETAKLGIESGDFIALDPRTKILDNGYIKSRFIDDKAQCAILLTILKYIKDNNIKLNRKVYAYFAMYEEIGHGTSYLPDDCKDFIALDIAPMGPDQTSSEKKVSIFAKDSRYPYHYELTNELRKVAKENNIDYVLDVFTPHYGSDGNTSIVSGHDIRHACIGPGTQNSHGYERTHIDGIINTYNLLLNYLIKY